MIVPMESRQAAAMALLLSIVLVCAGACTPADEPPQPATSTPTESIEPKAESSQDPQLSIEEDDSLPSLGISRSDIQVWLHPAGFSFTKRADLYGQPHLQGVAGSGARISLIGPPENLTRIDYDFEITLDDALNEVNAQYIAAMFEIVLGDDAGPAFEWFSEQIGLVKDESRMAAKTFGDVTVDFGADPDGYVRFFLLPVDD